MTTRGAQVDYPWERLVGGNMDITNGRQAKVIERQVTAYVQVGIRGVDSGET